MPFPPHTDVSIGSLMAVAEHHGLHAHPITRLPDGGIYNAIYLLGDNKILRIPRRHPAHYRALYIESVAVPLARASRAGRYGGSSHPMAAHSARVFNRPA